MSSDTAPSGQCIAIWIDAWEGRGTIPGYAVCRLMERVEKRDGVISPVYRVERSEPLYVDDHPTLAALQEIHTAAQQALIRGHQVTIKSESPKEPS